MARKKPTMAVKRGKTVTGGSGLPKFMYLCDDDLEYDRADLARMAELSLDGMVHRMNICGFNNPLLLLPPDEYREAKKAITMAKDRQCREQAMAEHRRHRAAARNNKPTSSHRSMDDERTHNLIKLRPIGSFERTLKLRVDQDQYRGRG